MFKKLMLLALTSMVMTGSMQAAQAAPNADDTITYRKSVMAVIGGNFTGVMKGVQGKLPDPAATRVHAEMLAKTVSLALVSYKENTTGQGRERTTASPEIWSKWAGFEKEMKAFEVSTQKISTLVASGDTKAAAAEVGALGKSCKSCHDSYRKK